jgi:DNA polymerase elongation subunit (family B)
LYQNVFINKKEGTVYLWDDEKGMTTFPYRRYAYRRAQGGKYKSLYGDELDMVTAFDDRDPTLFESDVAPEMRVLIDQYENSDDPSTGHKVVVIDIEVSSEGGFPDILKADKTITAIAFFDQAANKYYSFVLDPESKISGSVTPELETRSYKCEDTLLHEFLTKWEEIQPSIVTGWNTNNFDIPYIYNRVRAVLGKQASYRLSPIGIAYQNKFNHRMVVAGVAMLDYMELYKKFVGVMKPSWSLANVAKDEELKVQKITYKGSLTNLYKTDIHRYAEYNLVDVKVVVELDKKYDFIHLAQAVCHKGHVPYEWFQMSSRFIDGAILMYLRRNGKVAPNKPIGGREEYEEMQQGDDDGFTGAFVKEPISGLYDWICSADITSLYPSVIMTLNISPETKLGKIEGWNMMSFQRGEIPVVRVNERGYSAADFTKMIANYTWSISANGVVYSQPHRKIIGKVLTKG